MDYIIVLPPDVENGAFMVLPKSVWYAQGLPFFLPHHKPTPGSKHLNVHSSQLWKYMTIQRMVIIVIIVIIVFIVFIIVVDSLL